MTVRRSFLIGIAMALLAAGVVAPQAASCASFERTAQPSLVHCCCDGSDPITTACSMPCAPRDFPQMLAARTSSPTPTFTSACPLAGNTFLAQLQSPVSSARYTLHSSPPPHAPPRRYLLTCALLL